MKKFIILLIITFLIPGVPALFLNFNTNDIIKPSLFPPKILFPIVWSIIYILMTTSLYLSTKNDDEVKPIYFIQLFVNAIWSPIFFGLRNYFLALIILVILIILTSIMMYKMFYKNKIATYLQIPYIIWLCFAFYLNLSVYLLN